MTWVVIANLKGAPGDAAALGRFEDIDAELARLRTVKVETNDHRLPQNDGWNEPEYAWAVVDNAGRLGVGVKVAGAEAVIPGGIETPRAGQKVDSIGYSYVTADPSGRIGELCQDLSGQVPDWVLARWGQRMPLPGGAGVRLAGVALTLPDSTTPSATHNNVTGRLPVKIGAYSGRWRVHIANHNDKNSTYFPGVLSFTGVYIGKHQRNDGGELTGQFDGAPQQIAGAFNSAPDGSDWASDWVENFPLEAGKDYVLSYGYTSATQSNYLASGGGWQSNSSADVAATTPALVASKTMPLDVWIEVEVAGSVKVIAYNGDSMTCGLRSTLPIYDSWPARHAVANGLIHTMYAHGGSELGDWLNPSARKWTKFAGLSKPDALINAHGNNDIYRGSTLSTTQANFVSLVNQVRANLTDNIYAATVMPRIDATTELEAVRDSYNAWLQQTPAGIQATFDFAAVIEDSSGNPDVRWRSEPDNFHLNTAGYSRCSLTINSPLA